MSEIVCPKCDGYIGGHATGSGDICTCTPMFSPTCKQCAEKDREIAVAESQMEIMAKEVFTARAKLQIAREALKEIANRTEPNKVIGEYVAFGDSTWEAKRAQKALEQIGE